MTNFIWTLVTVLLMLWIASLMMSIGGQFIHVVLVIALCLMVYNLVSRARTAR